MFALLAFFVYHTPKRGLTYDGHTYSHLTLRFHSLTDIAKRLEAQKLPW